MSEEKLELAKEIFWRYNGLFFHMDREGEYEKYKSFDISKNQERAWREERRDELFEKLSIEKNKSVLSSLFFRLEDITKDLGDQTGIEKMFLFAWNNCEQFDTFTTLLLVERVVDIVTFVECEDKFKRKILRDCSEMLKKALKKPILVSMDYEEDFYEPMTEERVRDRINVLIRQCSE